MDRRTITGLLLRNQWLSPAYQGEDLVVSLGSTIYTTTDSPTTWSVRFTLVPASGGSAVITSPSISATVTGSAGAWATTFSIPIVNARTSVFGLGIASYQLDRDDIGSAQVLATGSIEILPSLAVLP